MEPQRRTFLKGAGATAFTLAPGIRGTERQDGGPVCLENGTCREKLSRNADESPLSQREIEATQRRVLRTHRRRFGSTDPISVGRIGPLLEFPLYSFAYTIDAQGRSSFMVGGPKDLDRPRGEPTTEAAEETVTPPEGTVGTTELAAETTTEADAGSRIESVQRITDELQATAERSIPAAAEVDLSDIDGGTETTTTDGETTGTTRGATESAVGPPRAPDLGPAFQEAAVDMVSLGIAVVGTEAGTIVSRSRLYVDYTLPPRRAHLVLQDFRVQPNRDQGWRIQSAEAVHDWRSGYAPVITVVQHEPSGLSGGPVFSRGVELGLSGPGVSWSYSQPDVTRENLSEPRKAKWRWRWNRSGAGRNSEAFKIGSLVTSFDAAQRNDHLCVVRSGATFRRGTLLFERTGKVRVAQAFRYE